MVDREEIEAPHPWSFIAEEMLARGWSTEDLAIRMAVPDYDEQIEKIGRNILALDIYRTIGPTNTNCRMGSLVKPLAKAFDVNAAFFAGLEEAWLASANKAALDAHRSQDKE